MHILWYALIATSVVSSTTSTDAPKCSPISDVERFDCHPDVNANPLRCQSRGCCWAVPEETAVDHQIDIPFCFFPLEYNGYTTEGRISSEIKSGFSAELSRPVDSLSGWPEDIPNLQFDIIFETQTRVHFKIYDHDKERYEVPIELGREPSPPLEVDYGVSMSPDPFQFAVFRKSTGVPLFNSWIASSPLIFANQFIQWSTLLPTPLIYGLGEHVSPFLHRVDRWRQLTFWARDMAPRTKSNLYGVHPFYLGLEKDGKAFGVFLLNSNAMEIDFQPLPALTFRTIGGILDFYVFTGPTYDDVIEQYSLLIGHSFLPPYWSLGFHLCRYDYGNDTQLRKVIARTKATNIPYEVQWNDIDYMDEWKDFTFSPDRYAKLPEIVDELHRDDMKYIIIIDPGISSASKKLYPPYETGVQMDIFIRNSSTQLLLGKVWPGECVFPDFSNPKAEQWWYEQAKEFHDHLPFDGLWTDMNEPSNFVDGSLTGCTDNLLDRPPYVPGIMNGDLSAKTICPSARHHLHRDYDLHSLYGHYESIATHRALNRILNERSVVITRSSFPSTGRYAGHWSGDVGSTWDDLYYSIPVMLNFQMFGIPFVGADVCGFLFDTTEELCIRWMQLGSYYPFMRNHNDRTSKEQDPGVFSKSAQEGMRTAVSNRYTLLPYLYTLLWRSNSTGSPVVRPLLAQYPKDENVYSIDKQFLWGDAIMICPVLSKGTTNVSCYFPYDRWFDVTHRADGATPSPAHRVTAYHGGYWVDFSSSLKDAALTFQRGGTVVVRQASAITTTKARKNKFYFMIAYDEQEQAKGDLYFDDGRTFDHTTKQSYVYIGIYVGKDYLYTKIMRNEYAEEEMLLDEIILFGLREKPSNASIASKPCRISGDPLDKIVIQFPEAVSLREPFKLTWSYE